MHLFLKHVFFNAVCHGDKLCHLPWGQQLAACLTCLSQPQFYTELFWDTCGVLFLSNARLGCPAVLTPLQLLCYSHWQQTNMTLTVSDSTLHCVEWNFGKWIVWYDIYYTVHTVWKSGVVQQHPYWRTHPLFVYISLHVCSLVGLSSFVLTTCIYINTHKHTHTHTCTHYFSNCLCVCVVICMCTSYMCVCVFVCVCDVHITRDLNE